MPEQEPELVGVEDGKEQEDAPSEVGAPSLISIYKPRIKKPKKTIIVIGQSGSGQSV